MTQFAKIPIEALPAHARADPAPNRAGHDAATAGNRLFVGDAEKSRRPDDYLAGARLVVIRDNADTADAPDRGYLMIDAHASLDPEHAVAAIRRLWRNAMGSGFD